jgi:phosphoribosylamine--glycine ligase
MTIVGPEAPLVQGIAEAFEARSLRLIGPSAPAARLEGSKIFAKDFMARNSIPTARFTVCGSPSAALGERARDYSFPVVVKADGLAAGKGVRIAGDPGEFEEAIRAMMIDRVFGEAGSSVVLEECLLGREASLMIFSDGRDYQVIVPAQDYKRVYDGDLGPNTGGMGSFSTPGLLDDETLVRVRREIVEPTLEGMTAEGNPFRGVLYVGLMLTADGPRVIEYNVRMGDPETQAVLMRLDSDLVEIFEAMLDERIGMEQITWSTDSAVCVVAASGGYPGEFKRGMPISGLERKTPEGLVVFHSGTATNEQGKLVTAGGRVLGITARDNALSGARSKAYDFLGMLNFEGIHYRTDIARV